jgi:hypothetical protein
MIGLYIEIWIASQALQQALRRTIRSRNLAQSLG